MKVWIDISNAPHVRFFKDVIKYLEAEGEDVIVTARQFGDIHKLMEMYDIDFISVGKHGVSLYDKLKESIQEDRLVQASLSMIFKRDFELYGTMHVESRDLLYDYLLYEN